MSDRISFGHKGGLGIITLDSPRTLNAIDHAMVRALSLQLSAWRDDDGIRAVLIKGAGERAFCAGGDIRAIYDARMTRGEAPPVSYYADEYRLNWRIFNFPKPYIALMDGVTMGGGVGVSIHGSHRVVTERTLFAMPETGIGLFPDIGGSWFLPRLPGELGMALGLLGTRLDGSDCVHIGIADHFVPGSRLDQLEDALATADLAGADDVTAIIAGLAGDPGPSSLGGWRGKIDACFAGFDLDAVLAALAAEPTGWGAERLAEINGKSPTSLKVTFRQLRAGRHMGFADAMRLEYRLVQRFMAGHDFYEGVRAVLVDRDKRPRWRPDRLEDVSSEAVDRYFAPLPEGDLAFDWAAV